MYVSNFFTKVLCKISSKYKMKLLKSKFHHLGHNCLICTLNIDYPELVSLGDNVTLATNCKLLNHDYSVQVLRNYYQDKKLDKVGSIEIADNVFVGANSIILPNAKIASNCIFSACSVITGKYYEGNTVYGGVPAKPIMSIDEFYKKVKSESMKLPWIDKLDLSIDSLMKIREEYFFDK